MANGNQGIGSFLPFPTFGGEKSGGITPVQLSPMSPNFPTPRAINRRTPEPEFKEKIGGLAPLALQGIGQLFGGDDTPRTPDEYAMDELGLTEQQLKDKDLNKFQQAQLDAYSVYGEAAPKDDFGWDEIANIAAASMMGRGADDYATTYLALKKAAKAKEATKEISRADFIKSKTDANLQIKGFQDADAAALGILDRRVGNFDPDTGISYVPTDEGVGWIDIRKHPGSWVPIADIETDPPKEDPAYGELKKIEDEILTKETALAQTQVVANKLIEVYDAAEKDPGMNPLTVVSTIGNFFNDMNANVQALGSLFGGDILNGFATADDVANNLAGSYGRSGSGDAAKQLQAILRDSSKSDAEIQEAINKFRNSADVDGSYKLGDILEEMSYLNVRAQGTMFQLAYMLAGANGQTGRTLSDKDLAFHLQMLGSGATQSIKVARTNLIEVVDTVGESIDSQNAMIMGPQRATRYDLDDEKFVNIYRGYWKNPEDIWTNPNTYMTIPNLKTYQERYSNTVPGVSAWYSHDRRGKTKNQINTSEDLESQFEEDLNVGGL